jgi:hypothetical protein
MKYTIFKTDQKPLYQGQWNDPIWQQAETVWIDKFHPQSTEHHPKTAAKVLYDDENLYVIFRVQDQYVKAVYTAYQDPVYQDSCVEFFVMPTPLGRKNGGYFNFELNCIGTLLVYYIEDSERIGDSFKKCEPIKAEFVHDMTVFHSIPGKIDQEIATPIEWSLEYNIPFALFEAYLGPLNPGKGIIWKGNFYKCGDHTSHPHWASWSSIGEVLNFHQPNVFGKLEFGQFRR